MSKLKKLVHKKIFHRQFESVVKYCSTYSNLIPLSFVLGFYVSIVMTRWWNQYTSIPWPDPIAVFVSANVHGQVNIDVTPNCQIFFQKLTLNWFCYSCECARKNRFRQGNLHFPYNSTTLLHRPQKAIMKLFQFRVVVLFAQLRLETFMNYVAFFPLLNMSKTSRSIMKRLSFLSCSY